MVNYLNYSACMYRYMELKGILLTRNLEITNRHHNTVFNTNLRDVNK